MNVTGNLIAISGVFAVGLGVSDISEQFWTAHAPPLIEGSGTVSAPVEAGAEVFVYWDIIKRTSCPGFSSRVWRGEDGFFLVEAETPTALTPSLTRQTVMIPTVIPGKAPPGDMALTIEGRYECDGVRHIPFALGPVDMTIALK